MVITKTACGACGACGAGTIEESIPHQYLIKTEVCLEAMKSSKEDRKGSAVVTD